MPVTNIRGVNINWQQIGDRGPWIMLTTGGRRGHDEFIPLAKKLAARGAAVDMRPPDIMRITPAPLYNSFEDVQKLGALLDA